MSYIFMDESGDLGFDFDKSKTSRYFIITFLFARNLWELEKIIKKIFQWFDKNEIKRHNGVLHCHKEHPKTRMKIYKNLITKDIDIMTIYLDKKKVYTKLQEEKHILYNYISNILLDRIFTKKLVLSNQKINLVASKRETNKFLNENFKDYLRSKLLQNHKIDINIDIIPHHQSKLLQLVDFVSWWIFRKYERSDDSYYDIFKSKIVEEKSLF